MGHLGGHAWLFSGAGMPHLNSLQSLDEQQPGLYTTRVQSLGRWVSRQLGNGWTGTALSSQCHDRPGLAPESCGCWGVYLGANSDSRHACHGASSSVKGGTPHHEIPPKHHEIQHGQECPRVETCTGGGEPHRLTESQIASKHASWSRHFRSSAASLSRTPHGTSPQPRRSAISLSLNCEDEFQAS